MNRCAPLFAFALAFALPAHAAPLEEAKQALREAAPQHCEVLTLQFESRSHPAGSAARAEVQERLVRRAGEVDRTLATQTRSFERARARLNEGERAELNDFAMGLLDDCARRASATHGVQLQVPITPPPARPQIVPHAPPAIARQPAVAPE